jgi:hypothetical protein
MSVETRGHLRLIVIQRDRYCVAAALDLLHECRDAWGQPHAPYDMEKLTLEHVRDRRGRRFDLPEHCVAMCSKGNVTEHWTNANKERVVHAEGVQSTTTGSAESEVSRPDKSTALAFQANPLLTVVRALVSSACASAKLASRKPPSRGWLRCFSDVSSSSRIEPYAPSSRAFSTSYPQLLIVDRG